MRSWPVVFLGFCVCVSTFTSGCASAQTNLRAPLAEKCAVAGLQQCPEMVDGVLAYVTLPSAEAEQKIRTTAAKSPPERVKDFVNGLRPLMDLPRLEAAARPIGEIIDLLSNLTDARASGQMASTVAPPRSAPNASAAGNPGNVLGQLAREDAIADQDARLAPPHVAAEDFRRIRTSTVAPAADAKGVACEGAFPSAKGGTCAKVSVFNGPFVLTDLYAPGGCGDELVVYSDNDANRSWTIFTTPSQPLSVHGAQLVVAKEEKLFVAAKNEKGKLSLDPLRCSVTFSGWRPEFPGVHYLMLE